MCDGDAGVLPDVDNYSGATREMRNFGTRLGTFLINEAVQFEEKAKPSEGDTPVDKLEVFSVCAAVVSKELVSALPATVNILLKQFGAQHRVAYRKIREHRIFFGTGKWLSQAMEHLPKLVEKHRDSGKVSKQRAESAAKQIVGDKKMEEKIAKQTSTDKSVPKRRGRPKGKKNLSPEDSAHQLDTVTPDSRRISSRLSRKPRRSYAALHHMRQVKEGDSDGTAQDVDKEEGQRSWQMELRVVEVSPHDEPTLEPGDLHNDRDDPEDGTDSAIKCEVAEARLEDDGEEREVTDESNHGDRVDLRDDTKQNEPQLESSIMGSSSGGIVASSTGGIVASSTGSVVVSSTCSVVASSTGVVAASSTDDKGTDMTLMTKPDLKHVQPRKRISSDQQVRPKHIKRRRRCTTKGQHECDICFKTFPYIPLTQKHRRVHFTSEGHLSPPSIVIHIQMLAKTQRAETLTGDLLQQVKNYKHKIEADGGDRRQPLEVVTADLVEAATSDCAADIPTSSKRKGRKAHLERGIPVVVGGQLVTASGEIVKAEDGAQESSTASGFVACDQCCCTLRSAKSLRAHKKNVHQGVKKQRKRDSTPLHCPHCDFVCDRTQNFTKHLKSHSKADVYTCNLCSYRHKERAEVMRHQRNAHAEKSHQCPHCSTKHRNQALLRMHIRTKHEKAFSVMCETCGKELYSRAAYNKHMERHADELSSEPNAQIMCNLCARTLKTKSSFQKHLAKFHSDEKESVEMREANEGVNVLANGLFQCRYCAVYSNSTAREVRRHIVRRHMKKTHQCDQCKVAFPLDSLLQKHIRVVHYGLEKKKCPKCNKWFRNNAFLTAHFNKVHSEMGMEHRCPVCNKNFGSEKSMILHSDIHKPPEERVYRYSCEMCDRKFRSASNYDYHMLAHTGKRAFSCAECGVAFSTKNVLDSHMATHSEDRPFVCDICDKKFKLKKYLNVHLLIHAGNNFMCSLCHKGFGTSEALDKHTCKSMVISQTTLVPDIQISEVDLDSGHLAQVNRSVLVNINDDSKQASENVYFMCSACNEGFDDVHGAADHVCLVKVEAGDGTVQRDPDNVDVGEAVADHQNYSLISQAAPQLELSVAGDSAVTGSQKSQHLAVQSLPPENIDLATNVPEVHQTMFAVAEIDESDTKKSALDPFVSKVPEPEDTSVLTATPVEMYMCGICNSLFVSQEDVQVHIQLHNQEGSAPVGLGESDPGGTEQEHRVSDVTQSTLMEDSLPSFSGHTDVE